MPALVTQTVTGATSFTLAAAPSDNALLLGISGTYSNLSLKIEGLLEGVYYPIQVFQDGYTGPLSAPLTPSSNATTSYTGRCEAYTGIKVTITAIAGSASMDLRTGSFFDNPAPQRMVGAGGTVGVTGSVSLSSGSVGQTETQNARIVELVVDEHTRKLLQAIDYKLGLINTNIMLIREPASAYDELPVAITDEPTM